MLHERFQRAIALLALISCCNAVAWCQQVIATSGQEFTGPDVHISFTIGELVIATGTAADVALTQGFQQPISDISTEVMPNADPSFSISAYPNPAREQITLAVEGVDGLIDLRLLDAAGRLISTHSNVAMLHTLDVSALASGSYILQASTGSQLLSSLKINITR